MMGAAAATALAGTPALGEAAADEVAIIHAAICAEGGRRFVEIDLGGYDQREDRRHAPCHAGCLVERTEGSRRRTR